MAQRFHAKGALVVLALVSLSTVVFAGSAGGQRPAGGVDRFTPIADEGIQTAQIAPLGVSNAPTTVMVELEGATVAEAQGDAGRELSEAEKQQVVDQLKAKQDALKGQIQALGGTVLDDFQYAYNGLKVEIARNKVNALSAIAGVIGVHGVRRVERDNVNGVPLIGAPTVWGGVPGLRGEGQKIAIVDTGIDYTHANFGGPGTSAAYDAANATDTLPADPTLFGPSAVTKIKGGTDFVGDNFDSSDPAKSTPAPDPNPLDCNGHGSHVGGTAAGFGVTKAGDKYTGSYDAGTVTGNEWRIGPGVAPKADIYGVRVFGCDGSTTNAIVVQALEWAVANDMDVVNMSLGSPFGKADEPDAVAATHAAKAGVIIVASAGNSGPGQYITGSPAAGTGAISVAANDPMQVLPAAIMALSTGATITALNANGAEFAPTTYNVVRIFDNPATPTVNESLGCNVSDYGVLPANAMPVVLRGVCARVGKAIRGQQAGAAAVAMINNTAGYPPFEGKITSHPDTGEKFTVTIPFFGIRGADGATLNAAHGGTSNTSPTTIPNPGYKAFASFSSGGPRTGDSWLKPDVTAPGVSIASTLSGSGNDVTVMSGTSMAAPHTAGMAALVKQAHPSWRVEDLKAAIVNTGDPSGVTDYRTSRGGTGLINAPGATMTDVVAVGDPRTGSLSYGFEQLMTDLSKTKKVELRNHGGSDVTFDVSQALASGEPHSVTFGSSTVTVPAGGKATLDVTLNVPAATVANSDAFREVAGLAMFTPQGGANDGVALKVPYYLVPRSSSWLITRVNPRMLKPGESATARVRNRGVISGDADFYAWGLSDPTDLDRAPYDVLSVGVQSFPNPSATDATRRLLVFAVNTANRWSNAATSEYDVLVDVDNDGVDDYVVVGVDFGAVTAGSFNGQMGSFVFSTRSPGASIAFFAVAPTDSSTLLLPFRNTQLCRTAEPCMSQAGNPRFTYHAASFDVIYGGPDDVVDGTAKFNAWSSSITQGDFLTVPPGGEASTTISINPAEWALTPAMGIMVVGVDDKAGQEEADTVAMGLK